MLYAIKAASLEEAYEKVQNLNEVSTHYGMVAIETGKKDLIEIKDPSQIPSGCYPISIWLARFYIWKTPTGELYWKNEVGATPGGPGHPVITLLNGKIISGWKAADNFYKSFFPWMKQSSYRGPRQTSLIPWKQQPYIKEGP